MRQTIRISATNALMALGLLVQAYGPASAQDANQAVEEAYAAWDEAFNAGDAAALTAFYTEDATLLPAGGQPVTGTENIQAFWQGAFDNGFKGHSHDLVTAETAGDVIYAAAAWSAMGPGEGGAEQSRNGHVMHVFERQDDGSLKVSMQGWNRGS